MSGLWCQVAVAYCLFVVIFAPIIEVDNSKSSRKFSQCPAVRSSTGSSRWISHKRPQHQRQHCCERSQLISHVYKNVSTILRFTLSFTEHITVVRTTSYFLGWPWYSFGELTRYKLISFPKTVVLKQSCNNVDVYSSFIGINCWNTEALLQISRLKVYF